MCINTVEHTLVYGIKLPWDDIEKLMNVIGVDYEDFDNTLFKHIPLSDLDTWIDHNQNERPFQGWMHTYYEGYEHDENHEFEHVFGININTGDCFDDVVKNITNIPAIVITNYEKYCLPLLARAGITPTEPSVHLYSEIDT